MLELDPTHYLLLRQSPTVTRFTVNNCLLTKTRFICLLPVLFYLINSVLPSWTNKMILTVQDIIKKKRDKCELDTEEINFFIESTVNGTATEAQIGAWLMAVFLNGMSDREVASLTKAMALSGEQLQWDHAWEDLLVDKHSTGGVGDKISLILAPALASCGLKVPMLSGRGLGFTGGTLDKLESIPGFQVYLTPKEMYNCLDKVGCFIAGQTDVIATADKILYKQRDLTNTVDCLPLIASSILSKKAVEGIRTLVMDIKVGSGALIKDEKEAEELSCNLINISKLLKMEISVLISDMNTPIGRNIGNTLEVIESVECLKNKGSNDVNDLVQELGGLLLHKKGLVKSVEEGKAKIAETLTNGTALNKFRDMLLCQGVSEETAKDLCNENFSKVLKKAKYVTKYSAQKPGVVSAINAGDIGKACWYLNNHMNETNGFIDYAVGIKLLKLVGEEIKLGEEWVEIHHNEKINKNVEHLINKSLVIDPMQSANMKKSRVLSTY